MGAGLASIGQSLLQREERRKRRAEHDAEQIQRWEIQRTTEADWQTFQDERPEGESYDDFRNAAEVWAEQRGDPLEEDNPKLAEYARTYASQGIRPALASAKREHEDAAKEAAADLAAERMQSKEMDLARAVEGIAGAKSESERIAFTTQLQEANEAIIRIARMADPDAAGALVAKTQRELPKRMATSLINYHRNNGTLAEFAEGWRKNEHRAITGMLHPDDRAALDDDIAADLTAEARRDTAMRNALDTQWKDTRKNAVDGYAADIAAGQPIQTVQQDAFTKYGMARGLTIITDASNQAKKYRDAMSDLPPTPGQTESYNALMQEANRAVTQRDVDELEVRGQNLVANGVIHKSDWEKGKPVLQQLRDVRGADDTTRRNQWQAAAKVVGDQFRLDLDLSDPSAKDSWNDFLSGPAGESMYAVLSADGAQPGEYDAGIDLLFTVWQADFLATGDLEPDEGASEKVRKQAEARRERVSSAQRKADTIILHMRNKKFGRGSSEEDVMRALSYHGDGTTIDMAEYKGGSFDGLHTRTRINAMYPNSVEAAEVWTLIASDRAAARFLMGYAANHTPEERFSGLDAQAKTTELGAQVQDAAAAQAEEAAAQQQTEYGGVAGMIERIIQRGQLFGERTQSRRFAAGRQRP